MYGNNYVPVAEIFEHIPELNLFYRVDENCHLVGEKKPRKEDEKKRYFNLNNICIPVHSFPCG